MAATNLTALALRQRPIGSLFHLLSCVRLGEVLLLQGSPLLGVFFAMGSLTLSRFVAIALLVTGSTFITAHVFVLNDWSGVNSDLRNPQRRNGVFVSKGIGREAVAFLSLGLLSAGLLLLSRFGPLTPAIALVIVGLSALYSFPAVHLKGVPVLSSLLHFAGGLLHFLLGYSIFIMPGWRGMQIGSFFGLVFMAGHLNHEIRDSESDRISEIRTNAVVFGKLRSFLGGLLTFAAADGLLLFLALRHVVPSTLSVVVFLFPLHLYWSWRAIHSGLTFACIERLQACYRASYAAIGLWMVVAILLETQHRGSLTGH